MTDVRIDRRTATAADWPEPDQVPTMLQHVSADRLERALRANPLPEGDWCVRRLDVAVDLDPDRPLSALETDWADRIVTALRLSLRDGSQDVVRYLRPEQAVDDLLLGLSTGHFDRAWAWRQVGLLEANDPEPRVDPGSVFLLVLARLGHGRFAAVERLIRNAGVAAAHRLLGSAGWVRVAALAAAEAGTAWAPGDSALPGSGPSAIASGDTLSTPAAGRADALAAAVTASGDLAPALQGSGLRVDGPTLQAWAVLVIGAADPSLLRAAPLRLRDLVMAVVARLRPQASAGLAAAAGHQPSASPRQAVGPRPVGQGGVQPAASRASNSARAAEPSATSSGSATTVQRTAAGPDPEQQEAAERSHLSPTSSWGGLLFLLNTAADAGLPAALDEPPFDAHPAPSVLHRLGRAIVPADVDDPALMAFSGLTSGWPTAPLKKAQRRAVTAMASSWVAATAKRLRPNGAPRGGPTDAELVQRLVRRSATIEMEPGWVEVGLRLDEVDLDVRRAGLDIDPGWVWWLGHVVRFRYE